MEVFIPDGYETARDNYLRFGNELVSFFGISELYWQLIGAGVHWSIGATELLRLSELDIMFS
jgi:hypothetical protein